MNITGAWLAVLLLYLSFFSGATEKRKRVKKVGSSEATKKYFLEQELNPERSRLNPEHDVPLGFIHPEVKEYLELGKSVPGRPGKDYPVLGEVPYTSFYCDGQRWPGFFADVETRCQAWHYCDIDGRQATFLCPNGTQFSQAVLVCDWWFNVRCDSSFGHYSVNGRLYHKRIFDHGAPYKKTSSITSRIAGTYINLNYNS